MRNRFGLLLLAPLAVLAIGCSETLDGGAACPSLCPEQNIEVEDTILEPLSLDTTLVGYPPLGTETRLLLASRADLDVRAVVRFDSLTTRFVKAGADSAITQIDSTYVLLRFDNAGKDVTAPVTIEAYDVDTSAPDTSLSSVLALFRSDRLIGSITLTPTEATDSVKVPLSNAVVLAKILAKQRLRVGFRLTSAAAAELQIFALEGGAPTRLSYDPHPDTAIHAIPVEPLSKTPTDLAQLAAGLTDYAVIARGSPAEPAASVGVGGMPARRAYLRFALPSAIADSSTVLRATLTLTQRPNRGIDDDELMVIYPQILAAGPPVTDLAKAVLLLVPRDRGGLLPNGRQLPTIDSLRIAPADSGTRTLEIAGVIQEWRARQVAPSQRVLVLQAVGEGATALEALFFSSEAPAAVRPRLRITYVSSLNFGVP